MKKVKYNRISSLDQSLLRQELNSNEFEKTYSDKVSGNVSFFERKEASKLVNDINSKKVTEVHVSSIDRLGRNILDILNVVEFFTKNNVNLYVENIGMYSLINGEPNPTFKMIASVLGNCAEMERLSMLERQKQGILIAKANGMYKGRLLGTKMTDTDLLEKHKKVVKELKAGLSLRRAAKLGGCSLGTAQKLQKLLLQ